MTTWSTPGKAWIAFAILEGSAEVWRLTRYESGMASGGVLARSPGLPLNLARNLARACAFDSYATVFTPAEPRMRARIVAFCCSVAPVRLQMGLVLGGTQRKTERLALG
jgi:hypothetical protein